MKLEDLKGYLLARAGNLEAQTVLGNRQLLELEQKVGETKALLAKTHGALEETKRTLELIDQPPTPSS